MRFAAAFLIAEIQQNSNITYRVYDYNRRGADGKLRELHVDDALAVIEKIPDPLAKRAQTDLEHGVLARCGYFADISLCGCVFHDGDGEELCSFALS